MSKKSNLRTLYIAGRAGEDQMPIGWEKGDSRSRLLIHRFTVGGVLVGNFRGNC